MALEKFTLTLGRWHSINERLNKELVEVANEAQKGLVGSSMQAWSALQQKDVLVRSSQKAFAALRLHEEITNTQSTIRAALGRANAESGVSDQLAQGVALRTRLNLLKMIVDMQRNDQLALSKLDTLQLATDEQNKHGIAATTIISLRLMSDNELEELRAEVKRLKAAVSGNADAVHDLNRQKLTIELDAEIMKLAGVGE